MRDCLLLNGNLNEFDGHRMAHKGAMDMEEDRAAGGGNILDHMNTLNDATFSEEIRESLGMAIEQGMVTTGGKGNSIRTGIMIVGTIQNTLVVTLINMAIASLLEIVGQRRISSWQRRNTVCNGKNLPVDALQPNEQGESLTRKIAVMTLRRE